MAENRRPCGGDHRRAGSCVGNYNTEMVAGRARAWTTTSKLGQEVLEVESCRCLAPVFHDDDNCASASSNLPCPS